MSAVLHSKGQHLRSTALLQHYNQYLLDAVNQNGLMEKWLQLDLPDPPTHVTQQRTDKEKNEADLNGGSGDETSLTDVGVKKDPQIFNVVGKESVQDTDSDSSDVSDAEEVKETTQVERDINKT